MNDLNVSTANASFILGKWRLKFYRPGQDKPFLSKPFETQEEMDKFALGCDESKMVEGQSIAGGKIELLNQIGVAYRKMSVNPKDAE